MKTENVYAGITHTVQISSDVIKTCNLCSHKIGGENVANSINHYMDKHGYKLWFYVDCTVIFSSMRENCGSLNLPGKS